MEVEGRGWRMGTEKRREEAEGVRVGVRMEDGNERSRGQEIKNLM